MASLDVAAVIVIVYAIAQLTRAPRSFFVFGPLSKVAWVVWSAIFTLHVGHALLPAGALLALRRLRALKKRQSLSEPRDLPFAIGTPVDRSDDTRASRYNRLGVQAETASCQCRPSGVQTKPSGEA